MYASLAIQPPVQSQPATGAPPPPAEAQGFGEALRRAVAAPAGASVNGAAAADALPTAPPPGPPSGLASLGDILDPAEVIDPATLLPAALALAATALASASPATAKASADKPEPPEAPDAAPPKPDGIAPIPTLVLAPPPLPPAPPATAGMISEPAPSAPAMPTSPATTLQPKAAAQRGTAAAALPQAETGPHAVEAGPQPAPAAALPVPLPMVAPAFPPATHELAHNAPPHAMAGPAEVAAGPDAQAALLSAMPQPAGQAPREAPAAAPMPPARQVMPMAMAMLLSPGATPTLSVTLDPAELGRLEIRVGREAGGASLRLIAERPETLSLLVRDQRDLQQGLAQSGITLNADGIRFEMAEQDGHSRQEQQRRPGGRSRSLADANSTSPQQAFQLSLLDIRI